MKNCFRGSGILLVIFWCQLAVGQVKFEFNDTDGLKVGKNWKVAGKVSASLTEDEKLETSKGVGILVNLPDEKHRSNLITELEHGDADIEFDFMMAKHSNSGVYLQGRYEIQLLDSWGKIVPKYGDCGGIYQRRRPDGSQFEGHAPLINACKAPGTWQHMKISFRAPRFDMNGKKIENAKILFVDFNGYRIHEEIEMTGPTGGPLGEDEVAMGPIMIQGDHGPVAFRNFSVTRFETPNHTISDINYEWFEGDKYKLMAFNFEGAKRTSGKLETLKLPITDNPVDWAFVASFQLDLKKEDDYWFGMQAAGQGSISIDGSTVLPQAWTRPSWGVRESEVIHLMPGIHKVEVKYAKVDEWLPTYFGLTLRSGHSRITRLDSGPSFTDTGSDASPVYLKADRPTVSRSFMRIRENSGTQIVTRSVQVGSPQKIHYSYDLSNGSLYQLWRGDFLDMSPMWNDRGDGTSRPMGSLLFLGNMTAFDQTKGWKSKGYELDDSGVPTFIYSKDKIMASDKSEVIDGKYIKRSISVNDASSISVPVIRASKIVIQKDGLVSIDDMSFFIRPLEGTTSEIKDVDGKKVLVLSGQKGLINYEIIF